MDSIWKEMREIYRKMDLSEEEIADRIICKPTIIVCSTGVNIPLKDIPPLFTYLGLMVAPSDLYLPRQYILLPKSDCGYSVT